MVKLELEHVINGVGNNSMGAKKVCSQDYLQRRCYDYNERGNCIYWGKAYGERDSAEDLDGAATDAFYSHRLFVLRWVALVGAEKTLGNH